MVSNLTVKSLKGLTLRHLRLCSQPQETLSCALDFRPVDEVSICCLSVGCMHGIACRGLILLLFAFALVVIVVIIVIVAVTRARQVSGHSLRRFSFGGKGLRGG